jgi:SAM-dependent methyltransferase
LRQKTRLLFRPVGLGHAGYYIKGVESLQRARLLGAALTIMIKEAKIFCGRIITMSSTHFSYSSTELDGMAEAKNYYRWILSCFAPYLGKKVVEIGAGVGTFSEMLLNDADVAELVLVEPADNLFPFLKDRFSRDPRVRPVHGYGIENMGSSDRFDSVVLVNTIEHVESDEDLLKTVHRMLAPRGTVLLLAPALPSLYGSLDEAFGHVRRYTKHVLASKMGRAGFHIERLHYLNLPGVISWFMAGKIFRWRTLQPKSVRTYDRWVVPWISRIERYWKPGIGQSLVAVGRK